MTETNLAGFMARKYSFPVTEKWIADQLGDTPRARSLFQIAADFYAGMCDAIDSEGVRGPESARAAGAFGGAVRKWKAGLLQVITMDIINKTEADVSREKIRSLQKTIFGHAQASRDLRQYAVKIRNGGGRAAPLPEIPDDLQKAANKMFSSHEDDLRTAVHAYFARQ